MEDALAPHTAPPGTPAALSAVVLTRRRSHLDSASYRTLSRLFSHCFHIHPSLHAAPAHPEVEPAAANPIGEPPQGGSAPPKDAEFDGGKDVEEEASVGNPIPHETLAPSGVRGAAANPIADPGVAPQGSPEHEVAGVERAEGVQEMVVAGSTCGKTGAFVEELRSGAGLVGEDEAFRSMKACLGREDEESVEVAVENDNGQLLLDAMMTDFSGLIDDVSGGTMSAQSCGVSRRDVQNDGKVAEEVKELGGGIEEDRPVGNSDHGLADGGGFEEGEIEGDMQHLDADESGNSELEDEDADADGERLEEDFVSRGSGENESCDNDAQNRILHSTPKIKGNGDLVLNKEGNIKDDAQMPVARAQAVSYDEVVDWNETPLPDDEITKHEKKRKRHLTEERKAKKTKNKRVKRAQQRIAEGVKRLKLQPVIKPKVVQFCRFYLHGKCQQGNICKFSHDTTPLTKSKPCTHFARGSCLKGDDCPYDHELSKYPCHNFLENGMCVRGDKCKFSHVMPTAESPSTPDAKKSDAPLVSEKANRREQMSSQKTSTVYTGEPVTSAPTKHYSILKNLASVSVNAQKTSAPIPKGVQFLAFSKDRSNSSILHQDGWSTEKHRYTNGGQHHNFGGPQAAEGKKIVKQNGQRSAPLLDEKSLSKEATLHPCSEPKKTSLPTNSTAVPGSVSTKHEVSEASRILQEFLFGVGN